MKCSFMLLSTAPTSLWLAGFLTLCSIAVDARPSTDDKMLSEAFERLQAYDWGNNPAELTPIDQAIRDSAGNPTLLRSIENRLLGVLQSQAPRGAKDYVFRKLALVGSNASVPALAKLLPDKKLSHMARYALERMPNPLAGKALRKALGSVESDIQIGVIHSLGKRRDKAATSTLTKLLVGQNMAVARAAAFALGRIGTPRAGKALLRSLDDGPKEIRVTLTDASLDAAERLAQAGAPDVALALYAKLAQGDYPAPVRAAANRGRAKLAATTSAAEDLASGSVTPDQIKKLVPQASSMSLADTKTVFSSATQPTLASIENQSLTLLLLSLKPLGSAAARKEFRYLKEGMPRPSHLAAEISAERKLRIFRPRYVTYIHADRITDCTVKVAGSKATGTVSFKSPGLYEGKVQYAAVKGAKGWRIIEFSLPAHGIKTQLQASGAWKVAK